MAGAEGVQWLLTVANTINTVGDILDKLKGVHANLPDVVRKRIDVYVGLDTKEAKKSVTDEILYGAVLYGEQTGGLNPTESSEISAFEQRLRKDQPEKAEAMVLFVAKIVEEFLREIKETTYPEKGKGGPRIEQTRKNIADGLTQAVKFLREFLDQKEADENAKYQKRIDFLEGKNVFSLIPGKSPSPLPGKLKDLGKGIADAQTANLTELEKLAMNFRERAKQFRQNKGR